MDSDCRAKEIAFLSLQYDIWWQAVPSISSILWLALSSAFPSTSEKQNPSMMLAVKEYNSLQQKIQFNFAEIRVGKSIVLCKVLSILIFWGIVMRLSILFSASIVMVLSILFFGIV